MIRAFPLLLLLLLAGCATSPPPPSPLNPTALKAIPAGSYILNDQNAALGFAVSLLGVGKVEGVFARFEASLTLNDPEAGAAFLTATVDTTSVAVDNDFIQDLIVGEGWFEVKTYPKAMFEGALAGWSAEEVGAMGQVEGSLTLRDISQPARFDLRLTCEGIDDCPAKHIGFTADMTVNRRDYGMTRLPALVGNQVELSVSGRIRVDAADG